jgi:hypothetical protein
MIYEAELSAKAQRAPKNGHFVPSLRQKLLYEIDP